MAATPQYAIFKFVGMRTRKTYPVDAYISDVANALVRFDGGSGASSSSPDFWTAPGEPVVLTDVAVVTGTQDTTKIQLTIDGRPTSGWLRYAMHLTSLAMRPSLAIGVGARQQFRAVQAA